MSLEFSLSSLNEEVPYKLESSGLYSFSFVTEQGKKYEIGFIQDLMISDEGIYQNKQQSEVEKEIKSKRKALVYQTIE